MSFNFQSMLFVIITFIVNSMTDEPVEVILQGTFNGGCGFSIMSKKKIVNMIKQNIETVGKNELNNGDLHIIPVEGLPLQSNWNVIWLSQKKHSPVAQAFKLYLEENKTEIIRERFNWI